MKNIYAEIISIGDELLNGQTVNTNASWIAASLDELGIKTKQVTTISDRAKAIEQAIDNGCKHADILLITGGLGPTKDDITKKTIAHYFNSPLTRNQEHYKLLLDFFHSRGREMNELNAQQADLPACAERLPNDNGTAPGMWFNENNTIIISMPGVPREVKLMMKTYALPKLQQSFTLPIIEHRFLHCIGMGESDLSIHINEWENKLPQSIKLAYLPSLGAVKLRLTGTGTDKNTIDKELTTTIDKLKLLLDKQYIYSEEKETSMALVVADLLKKHKKTIATAESCTGGGVAKALSSIPGSSSYFLGSLVAYSNAIKETELNIPSEILIKHGAVSEETITLMAENIRKKMGTDIGIATSGIAGPDGGTAEKPVGTIWVAYADKDQTITKLLKLRTERSANVALTTLAILNLVRKTLISTTGENL